MEIEDINDEIRDEQHLKELLNMKDEIKEILDNIKNKYEDYYVQDIVSGNDLKQLLDYITNLQQENKILKENAIHNDKVVDKAKWNEMLYKSRNEKAIEYIKYHTEQRIYQEPYNIDGFPDRVEYFVEGKWNLLDILRGDE